MTKQKMTYQEALDFFNEPNLNVSWDDPSNQRTYDPNFVPDPRFYRFGEDDIEKTHLRDPKRDAYMAKLDEAAEILLGPI